MTNILGLLNTMATLYIGHELKQHKAIVLVSSPHAFVF